MADSDYVDMPTEGLLDTEYLEMRSKLIDASKASSNLSAGSPPTALSYQLSPDMSLELPLRVTRNCRCSRQRCQHDNYY